MPGTSSLCIKSRLWCYFPSYVSTDNLTWARLHIDLRSATPTALIRGTSRNYAGWPWLIHNCKKTKYLNITVYWCDALHYSAVSLRGGGSYYFHVQGRKIEAVLVFCREAYIYPETGRHRFLQHVGYFQPDHTGQITENGNSHSHDQEKLKPHKQMKY